MAYREEFMMEKRDGKTTHAPGLFQERRNWMDNLRNLTILLLFPVHTFMIWNDFGFRFYIWMGENKLLSTLIVLINPWFMPLLFVLAGMSARYALEKKTRKQFIKSRFQKLIIPFLAGIVFLVPFQTFYARVFFDGYTGGILENIVYFFSHCTDFSGYDGAFTPGHLWFILFLFVIAMGALVLIRAFPYEKAAVWVEKIPAAGVLLFFLPIWLMYYLGNFGGFSLGKNFALYLAGYYVLSNEAVREKLKKNFCWLALLCLIGTALSAVWYYKFSYYGDLWVNYLGWNTILVWIVLAERFLNKKTDFTVYFNQNSYSIYILHQSILVALAYYVVQVFHSTLLQAGSIMAGSFLLTVAANHALRAAGGFFVKPFQKSSAGSGGKL